METTAMTPGGNRLIVCGWCSWATDPDERCGHCNHESPEKPWEQRGETPPLAKDEREVGRPKLDASQIRERVRIARKELPDATNAQLAEHLDVSESTVRRWRKVADK